MIIRILGLVVIGLAFTFNAWAETSQDLVDLTTDTEEISADSEAAIAQAKAASVRAAKEQEVNQRALKDVAKARAAAEVKRQTARLVLKKTDAEIRETMAEQAKIKSEIAKLDKANVANEKIIQDSRARLEKLKKENLAAQELRTETLAKTVEVNKQLAEVLQSVKVVEAQHAQSELDFKQAAESEKLAVAKLEKVTVEETQKKNRLMSETAHLKERFRQIHANIDAMEMENTKVQQTAAKLEQNLRTGQAEVDAAEAKEGELRKKKIVATTGLEPLSNEAANDTVSEKSVAPAVNAEGAQRGLSTAPVTAGSPEEMTLKRDCNIREAPSREAKFLGVKRSGTPIRKSDEVKGWIAFPNSNGRVAFVMKNCF